MYYHISTTKNIQLSLLFVYPTQLDINVYNEIAQAEVAYVQNKKVKEEAKRLHAEEKNDLKRRREEAKKIAVSNLLIIMIR